MPDYNKGCIYMIKHNLDYNNENVYIGSCCNFTRRKCAHKNACNNPNYIKHNFKLYQKIRENGGWDCWVMIKLHDFPCSEKYQLNLEERRVIDLYQSKLNMVIPTRTIKEYYEDNKEHLIEYAKKYAKKYNENNKEQIIENYKKYYENNKEHIIEQRKIYHENNKEKLNEYAKKYREEHTEEKREYNKNYYENNKEKLSEKITCECGSIVRKDGLTHHHKSKKHLSFLDNTKIDQKII